MTKNKGGLGIMHRVRFWLARRTVPYINHDESECPVQVMLRSRHAANQ